MATAGVAVLTLALLAACGDGSSIVPMTPEMAAAAEGAGGLAGVAGAPVNCPAKIATSATAAGTLAYDILGVRPGMTYDEAVNVLRCTDNKLAATVKKENTWNINHAGIETRMGFVVEIPLSPEEEEARVQSIYDSYRGKGDGDDGSVTPGKVRYTASTVGVPGDERVIHLLSEQAFALDALPPVESLKASLIAKYGEPSDSHTNTNYRGMTNLYWVRDPSGAPMQRMCYITPTQYNLGDRCGSMVTAEITPDEKNFELASKLTVVSVVSDWGYNQLKKAEADLAALAAQRRAEGVEKAKDNAEAPKL